MVLPTALMTRSMTCTTPLVATWLPWMILAQFTVTILAARTFFRGYGEPFGNWEPFLFVWELTPLE